MRYRFDWKTTHEQCVWSTHNYQLSFIRNFLCINFKQIRQNYNCLPQNDLNASFHLYVIGSKFWTILALLCSRTTTSLVNVKIAEVWIVKHLKNKALLLWTIHKLPCQRRTYFWSQSPIRLLLLIDCNSLLGRKQSKKSRIRGKSRF